MCTAKLVNLLDRTLPEPEELDQYAELDHTVLAGIGKQKLQRIVQQRRNAAQAAKIAVAD